MRGLYWVRNDLRFHDNFTLSDFVKKVDEGIFVWCATRSFFRADIFRRRFILDSLLEFKSKIERLGGTFLVSEEPAIKKIPKLIEEYKITAVFFSQEPTFDEIIEERMIEQLNVKIFKRNIGSLINISDLPFLVSETPESFTKFRNLVEKKLQICEPLEAAAAVTAFNFSSLRIDVPLFDFISENPSKAFGLHQMLSGGESSGLFRLHRYVWELDCLSRYKETRNGMVNWDDSSKISAWLAVGALSPRQIYFEILSYEKLRVKNESTYWLFFELLWRDYFRLMAFKWQADFFTGMNGQVHKSEFVDPQCEVFRAWCEGRTGDDFVDANMHELNQTGWMSNRGRQNVASFLCHDLNVDWRLGAAYFEKKLIDYDASSNWGNWAYLAGVGQDSRSRAFDTQKQASFYDSDFSYRKLWLKMT